MIASAAALAACATTNEAGWTGSGAQPFDAALSECQTQVARIAIEADRPAALKACMAAKGWTRS